jgi:hypothetical protein
MTSANNKPEWFRLGEMAMWAIPRAVYEAVDNSSVLSPHQHNAVRCALIHFIHSLNLSVETNRKGQHAVSICLLRQCAEALSVIEIGLIRDHALSSSLLADWLNGNKTAGATRKELALKVWPHYGVGLWQESWSEFVSEFAKALHPYAHYSPELQAWQLALETDKPHEDSEGNYLLIARVGLETYEASKATRITILHVLLSYMLGRIAVENVAVPELRRDEINQLGVAIAASSELCEGKLGWHQQFWAHEFSNPNAHLQT